MEEPRQLGITPHRPVPSALHVPWLSSQSALRVKEVRRGKVIFVIPPQKATYLFDLSTLFGLPLEGNAE